MDQKKLNNVLHGESTSCCGALLYKIVQLLFNAVSVKELHIVGGRNSVLRSFLHNMRLPEGAKSDLELHHL